MEDTKEQTQDPNWEPTTHSRTRTYNYGYVEVGGDGKATTRYSVKNRLEECRGDVGDSSQVSEGAGGATRPEHLDTEVVNPGPAPNSTDVCEDGTNQGRKCDSAPRYNLRPLPGRKL